MAYTALFYGKMANFWLSLLDLPVIHSLETNSDNYIIHFHSNGHIYFKNGKVTYGKKLDAYGKITANKFIASAASHCYFVRHFTLKCPISQ